MDAKTRNTNTERASTREQLDKQTVLTVAAVDRLNRRRASTRERLDRQTVLTAAAVDRLNRSGELSKRLCNVGKERAQKQLGERTPSRVVHSRADTSLEGHTSRQGTRGATLALPWFPPTSKSANAGSKTSGAHKGQKSLSGKASERLLH